MITCYVQQNSSSTMMGGRKVVAGGIISFELMKLSNVFSKRNRVLLRELVVTDFKLRYQGSVLGYAWSLLKPLFLFAIMYVVFGMLVKLGSIEHYSVYLLLGIVLWTFFSEVTNQGMNSIIGRGDLLRKINFPKYIIVLSTSISALINLGLNLIIVVVLMIINGVSFSINAPMLILIIAEIYIFALGLAFFLAAFNVKYRDIGHIWEIVMQAAFYATPIIYPLSIVIERSQIAAQLLLISPIAQAIQDARYFLVTDQTETVTTVFGSGLFTLVPLGIVITVFVIGSLYFKSTSRRFAENI
jgi:ABC-2 type transport system permease protein